MEGKSIEPGSFRDRTSRILYKDGSVFRLLDEIADAEWKRLSNTSFFNDFMSNCKIIHTEKVNDHKPDLLSPTTKWKSVLKHEMIPFVSYPYEWPFGMLKDAALLQLELLLAAMDEDMILKDSSAFNFQWIGTKPIFIDIPSFVRMKPGEPWIGYRQFCQMFLYPLFLQAYKNIPYHPWLRGSIEGIKPQVFTRLMSVRDLIRPGVFKHVYLQAKLQEKYGALDRDIRKTLQAANFSKELIRHNVKNIDKIIRGLTCKFVGSEWSNYADSNNYSDDDRNRKKRFVTNILKKRHWHLIWDVGCNTGIFSRLAVDFADYVVAMDSDAAVIEKFYQTLKKEHHDKILPLVNNIADPSPNLGWMGLERKSVKSRGTPDLVICLALIHHMVINANIPLKDFIDWLAGLKADLLIEFVTKEDPMVKKLLQNKEDNYTDYDLQYFKQCVSESFQIIKEDWLPSGTRILFYTQYIG